MVRTIYVSKKMSDTQTFLFYKIKNFINLICHFLTYTIFNHGLH